MDNWDTCESGLPNQTCPWKKTNKHEENGFFLLSALSQPINDLERSFSLHVLMHFGKIDMLCGEIIPAFVISVSSRTSTCPFDDWIYFDATVLPIKS